MALSVFAGRGIVVHVVNKIMGKKNFEIVKLQGASFSKKNGGPKVSRSDVAADSGIGRDVVETVCTEYRKKVDGNEVHHRKQA